jgi:hypothetical protein
MALNFGWEFEKREKKGSEAYQTEGLYTTITSTPLHHGLIESFKLMLRLKWKLLLPLEREIERN